MQDKLKRSELAETVLKRLKDDSRFNKILKTVDTKTASAVTSTVETFISDLASCLEMMSHVDMKVNLINALRGHVVNHKSSGDDTMNDSGEKPEDKALDTEISKVETNDD